MNAIGASHARERMPQPRMRAGRWKRRRVSASLSMPMSGSTTIVDDVTTHVDAVTSVALISRRPKVDFSSVKRYGRNVDTK